MGWAKPWWMLSEMRCEARHTRPQQHQSQLSRNPRERRRAGKESNNRHNCEFPLGMAAADGPSSIPFRAHLAEFRIVAQVGRRGVEQLLKVVAEATIVGGVRG